MLGKRFSLPVGFPELQDTWWDLDQVQPICDPHWPLSGIHLQWFRPVPVERPCLSILWLHFPGSCLFFKGASSGTDTQAHESVTQFARGW